MDITNFINKLQENNLINNPLFWISAIFIQMILLFLYYPVIERKVNFIGSKFFAGNSIILYYLFFIGTVIHELSHLLACLFLWVRVGKVNFFGPQEDKNGGTTLGYVEHEVTDPFRATLIGIAPLFGSAFFTYLVFVWASPTLSIFNIPEMNELLEAGIYMLQNPFNLKNLLFTYVVIACAMAGTPSKADLTSLPLTITILGLMGGGLYLIKNSINWSFLGETASQATFLTPPLMLVGMILTFEIIILIIMHIIGGLIMRSWGYR